MFAFPTNVHDWAELLLTSGSIIGALWFIFVKFKKLIWHALVDFYKRVNAVPEKLDNALNILNTDVLPFIRSFQYEFSKNSGKSIKDQITRMEDSLKMAEIRSNLMSDLLIKTGEYRCNSRGETVWVNKALCELFGLNSHEMLGNGWLDAVDKDERIEVLKTWHENIENEIPHEAEYTVKNKITGEKFKVLTKANCHKGNDGKILGYYGTVIKLEP